MGSSGRETASKSLTPLERWASSEYQPSAQGLAVYRIFYASSVLLLFLPRFHWVTRLPSSFLDPPPGPFALLREIPSPEVMAAVELVLTALLIALLFGYHTRVASIALSAVAILGFGITYSFGKIDHNLLLWLVPAVLSPTGWGSRWSLDTVQGRGPPRMQAWPLAVLAILVGIAFFTAGVAKATTGWLNPSTHAVWANVVQNALLHGPAGILTPVVPFHDPSGWWELLDLGAVTLELSVLFLVIRRRVFGSVLIVLTMFHLAVFLLMGIAFTAISFVYAVFLPWARIEQHPTISSILRRWQARMSRVGQSWSGGLGLVISLGVIVWTVGRLYGPLLTTTLALGVGRSYTTLSLLVVEVVTAVGALWVGLRAMRHERAGF